MNEDHKNMPGMSDQPKKAEQAEKSVPPQKVQEVKRPDAAAQSDKSKPQPTPGKP